MRTILRAAGLLLAAAALMLVGPAAVAQAAGTSKHVSKQDVAFLRAAHQSNLFEIQTGKLAERKGKSAEVRELGRMFVKDHTKLDADLKKVAKRLGVDLPSRPNTEQRALAARLSKLSGSAFDKAWLDGQIVQHRKAKANGERELTKGSNKYAIGVAKKSAPVIKKHLKELRDTRADYNSKKQKDNHDHHG
jgi:putative membrane protein